MTAFLEKRRANLRTLIEAVAAERPEVPQEDVALLDDQERELLVQKKLTTRGVLVRTTYAELVAVGVTPGAAKVLKQLFPVPAEGNAAPTPRSYLCARMAGICLSRAALTAPSTHPLRNPYWPRMVREWGQEKPGAGGGRTLLEALLSYQKDVDVLYDMTKVPRMRPYSDVTHRHSFSTEGPVSTALDLSMLDPIQRLSQGLALQFAPGCAWEMLPSRALMQQGVEQQSNMPVAMLVSDAAAPGWGLLTAAASSSPQQAALAAAPAAAAAAASSSSTPVQQCGPAQEGTEAGPSSVGMAQGAAHLQPMLRHQVLAACTSLQAMLQGDQQRQQQRQSPPQQLQVFLQFVLSAKFNPSETAGLTSPEAGVASPAAGVRSQAAGKAGAIVGRKRSAEEAGNQLNTPKKRYVAVLEAKAVRVLAEEVAAPTGGPAQARLASVAATSEEAAATVTELEQQQLAHPTAAAASSADAALQPATSAAAAAAGSAATAVPAQQQEQQPAAHAPAGPPQVVVCQDADGEPPIRLRPRDLLRGWREQDQVATKVILQLYTYMQMWAMCYGAISCYLFTWLLYCPPQDRGTLYISPCFSCSTPASDTEVAAPAAVGWLTREALQHVLTAVAGPLPRSAPASGDEDSADSPQDDGALPGRLNKPVSRGPQGGAAQQTAPSGSPSLQFLQRVSDGCYGLVAMGMYCAGHRPNEAGEKVAIKLLGPDSAGLHSWGQELCMYRQLHSLQGRVIPRVVAAGELVGGVRFLATEWVAGATLAQLLQQGFAAGVGGSSSSLGPDVLNGILVAAEQGLQELQAAVPGFLHGDLRMSNLIIARAEPGMPPRCMFLDLGHASARGTQQQQQEELKLLRRLFHQELAPSRQQ